MHSDGRKLNCYDRNLSEQRENGALVNETRSGSVIRKSLRTRSVLGIINGARPEVWKSKMIKYSGDLNRVKKDEKKIKIFKENR